MNWDAEAFNRWLTTEPKDRGPEHDYCGEGIDEEFEHCDVCKAMRAQAREQGRGNPMAEPESTGTAMYAALPIITPAWYRPGACESCGGLGVTGDRYEMPADNGPVLLIEVICPDCGGCGNGDPDHAECDPRVHAFAEDFDADPAGVEWPGGEPPCPSCGGRTWNAVQGFAGEGESAEMAVLRVPCGCSAPLLVTGSDPSALAPYPVVYDWPEPGQ